MSKKKVKVQDSYTTKKRLYADVASLSSTDESEFDFETFNSGKVREKKFPKPTLKRSKREGMCLCSGDDTHSEMSEAEQSQSLKKCKFIKKPEQNYCQKNLITLTDDKLLEDFIKNY